MNRGLQLLVFVNKQNHNRRVRKFQTFSEMNWGELDEFGDVAYPEFAQF